jgi:hypothetical protein
MAKENPGGRKRKGPMAARTRNRRRGAKPGAAARKSVAKELRGKWELPFIAMFKERHGSLPQPVREFKFHPDRKWRFDLYWKTARLGVELHGGGQRGRHCRLKGLSNDTQKCNSAQRFGLMLLAYTTIELKKMQDVVDEVAEVVKERTNGNG